MRWILLGRIILDALLNIMTGGGLLMGLPTEASNGMLVTHVHRMGYMLFFGGAREPNRNPARHKPDGCSIHTQS